MEIQFDLNLVSNFQASVRTKGYEAILPYLSASLPSQKISTSLLTWAFSNRTKIDEFDINEIVQLDVRRQATVIGHNIMKESILSEYPKEESLYLDSIKLITDAWPEFYNLIDKIKPLISFQTKDREEYESESDSKEFGQIIYNMKSNCHAHWAEIIIHEMAHHYLNVILATTKMDKDIKNSLKVKHHSYQRNSERPLIGIFHGVFAQSCMLVYAGKAINSSSIDKETKDKVIKTYTRYGEIFPKDLSTIESKGVLKNYPSIQPFIDGALSYLPALEGYYRNG